jgi:hypothetical protein
MAKTASSALVANTQTYSIPVDSRAQNARNIFGSWRRESAALNWRLTGACFKVLSQTSNTARCLSLLEHIGPMSDLSPFEQSVHFLECRPVSQAVSLSSPTCLLFSTVSIVTEANAPAALLIRLDPFEKFSTLIYPWTRPLDWSQIHPPLAHTTQPNR